MYIQRDWCSAAMLYTGGCLQSPVCVCNLRLYAASRRFSHPLPVAFYFPSTAISLMELLTM